MAKAKSQNHSSSTAPPIIHQGTAYGFTDEIPFDELPIKVRLLPRGTGAFDQSFIANEHPREFDMERAVQFARLHVIEK